MYMYIKKLNHVCVFVLGTDKQKLWSFHVIVKSHKQSANRLKSHSKNSRFIIISRANMLHNNSCWNNFTAAIFNSNNSQYYFNNYHDRHFEILSLISQLVSTVHSFEKSVRPCSQYKWLDGCTAECLLKPLHIPRVEQRSGSGVVLDFSFSLMYVFINNIIYSI